MLFPGRAEDDDAKRSPSSSNGWLADYYPKQLHHHQNHGPGSGCTLDALSGPGLVCTKCVQHTVGRERSSGRGWLCGGLGQHPSLILPPGPSIERGEMNEDEKRMKIICCTINMRLKHGNLQLFSIFVSEKNAHPVQLDMDLMAQVHTWNGQCEGVEGENVSDPTQSINCPHG